MEDKAAPKESEFNSNYETLRRIGELMIIAHKAALNQLSDEDNDMAHNKVLDRIYIESVYKFDEEEEELCLKYQQQISYVLSKWGTHMFTPYYGDKSWNKNSNDNYIPARREFRNIVRQYEIFLIKCLTRHGMLLRDAKSGMEKFRG